MIFVLDSSFARNENLRKYLESSTSNFIALSEYIAIEAYKGDSYKEIINFVSILKHFPNQIIVLRNTMDFVGEDLSSISSWKKLIDIESSINFKCFCEELDKIKDNKIVSHKVLDQRKRDANKQIEKLRYDSSVLLEGYKKVESLYNKNDIKVFRKEGLLTEKFLKQFSDNFHYTTDLLFEEHPAVNVHEKQVSTNDFIYRYSLVIHLNFLNWIEKGSPPKVSSNKLVNDMIDAHFIALSTYFDGLLTKDNKMKHLLIETNNLIQLLTRFQ